MSAVRDEARLTSFLVKIASRCNLDCDYCYVYHHADQSWRSMPPILSIEDRFAFIRQLSAYIKHANLSHCVIVLHGGEPLLMGGAEIVSFVEQIRETIGNKIQLEVSLQTNGLLLTQDLMQMFRIANIGISLSLDGPKEVNDLHRNSRRGRSSFPKALNALELLKSCPDIFAGVISVIDPRVQPRQLFEFFNEHAVPKLDFLLPDAHHLRLPPGRLDQPDLYEKWLIEAFDLWFDEYSHIKVRTFDALLDSIVGLPSQTDAFGFGDVSLITIETDGSYHDLDVLKVVGQGVTKIGGTVRDTPMSNIAQSPALNAHRLLLRKSGLCETCQKCDVVDICGGGAVPHRHGLSGFNNPTVYCREMRALIKHVHLRVLNALPQDIAEKYVDGTAANFSLAEFERAETSACHVENLWSSSVAQQVNELQQTLKLYASRNLEPFSFAAKQLLTSPNLQAIAQQPGVVAWSRAMHALIDGRAIHTVDGRNLEQDPNYIDWILSNEHSFCLGQLQIHSEDRWLRLPFGGSIVFEQANIAVKAMSIFDDALRIIAAWRPAVALELKSICRSVQFVRDPVAEPFKIVSFSDNAVPGALFVSVVQYDQLIDAYDLADSLIHEYRHQKLYLLERQWPIVKNNSLKVVSPWRNDLRPPSGLFHAIFVFVELRRFWKYVLSNGPDRLRQRAEAQLHDTDEHLNEAFQTLGNCPLTETGRLLAATLQAGAKE